jgi:hypothetical protein
MKLIYCDGEFHLIFWYLQLNEYSRRVCKEGRSSNEIFGRVSFIMSRLLTNELSLKYLWKGKLKTFKRFEYLKDSIFHRRKTRSARYKIIQVSRLKKHLGSDSTGS